MKAIKQAVKHNHPGGFTHSGIGNLDITRPVVAVENIVPELAIFSIALVEAVNQAIVNDSAGRFRHSGIRHLRVSQPIASVEDVAPELPVFSGALMEAIGPGVEVHHLWAL
jgi:hypothetical protein